MRIPLPQKNRIENNSEAAYRIMAHLKMIDYELECMKDNNVQDLKKILSQASKYYSDTFKIKLKQHFLNHPEKYNYLIEHIEHGRMVSLQALFTLMFDCNTKGLEFFYDALIASIEDKPVNEQQKLIEYEK